MKFIFIRYLFAELWRSTIHTKNFLNCDSGEWIWIKHMLYKVFCFLWNFRPRISREIYITPDNRLCNGFFSFCTRKTHKLYEKGTFTWIFLNTCAYTYIYLYKRKYQKGLTCPKGWNSTKQNIKNNSCAPDINFLSIVTS